MKLLFTKRALADYLAVLDYLTESWDQKTAFAFKGKVETTLKFLKTYPNLGSLEFPEKGIFGCQISKYTRLFYRLKSDKIILLRFFDSRQHPDKRRL